PMDRHRRHPPRHRPHETAAKRLVRNGVSRSADTPVRTDAASASVESSGKDQAAKTRSLADKSVRAPFYRVIGQPEDLDGAKELAAKDKYGFQWWLLPLIGAKAYGSEAGKKEGKKGADRGIDGELVFVDLDERTGVSALRAKRVMVSVKGGHNVSVAQIRDLGHVIERENAAIGVFL